MFLGKILGTRAFRDLFLRNLFKDTDTIKCSHTGGGPTDPFYTHRIPGNERIRYQRFASQIQIDDMARTLHSDDDEAFSAFSSRRLETRHTEWEGNQACIGKGKKDPASASRQWKILMFQKVTIIHLHHFLFSRPSLTFSLSSSFSSSFSTSPP